MDTVQSQTGSVGRSTAREYHAYHDPSGAARLSTTVMHALADVMGENVTEVGFVLYDSVNPESLDRIFEPTADGQTRPPGHVAFTVQGYRVTTYSTGEIVITPPQPPRPAQDRP